MTASHQIRARRRVAAFALLIQLGGGCSTAVRPRAAAGTAGQAQTGAAAGSGGAGYSGTAGSV
ncbi:MAG TPA: hypothetical protein VJV78_04450, partial [Polyangiales bacterium]|nr:hypothetical protein [Polyangiales bacterium]